MAINLQALDKFRIATEWTAKGIANLDGDGIKQNGTYSGALSALGRSKIEQAANNDVRTELLKALGNAFGLAGMSEKDGTVTVSKGFMDKLERLLGADFKRDDFKIDADGKVASGRPLTSRRITAILAKVEAAAAQPAATQPAAAQSAAVKAESAGEIDKTVLSKTGGVRKDEIYGPYVEKLATLKHEIAGLDKEAYKHVFSFFSRVDKTLDFLYDEVDVDRKSENAPDPSGLRNDQEYEFLKEIGDLKEGDKPKFQYYDSKAGKFVQLTNTNDYRGKFLWDRLGGGLLHTERAKFSLAESDDIGALRKYVVDNLRLFVMKAIDTYFASKEAGKLDQFFEHLKAPGACIEDQCLHMVGFEAKHLTAGTTLSKQEIAELERIANQEPGADGPAVEDAETLFVDTFGDLDEEAWFDGMEKKSWTPDVSAFLKEKLVGKTCTMMTYNEASKHFEVMKNKQGAPVVRPLTAADIDTLCRKAFEKVYS